MSVEANIPPENVVSRLKRRLAEARGMGFQVRMEPLEDEQASWCEIGGVPTLFVDLSQTAGEQLQQLEETLSAYAQGQSASNRSDIPADPSSHLEADLAKRAA